MPACLRVFVVVCFVVKMLVVIVGSLTFSAETWHWGAVVGGTAVASLAAALTLLVTPRRRAQGLGVLTGLFATLVAVYALLAGLAAALD